MRLTFYICKECDNKHGKYYPASNRQWCPKCEAITEHEEVKT